MTREEGLEMIKKYDHVRPSIDLERWFKYTKISEEDFNICSEKFRDSRVWYIKNNKWFKKNIWGGESSFGNVYLSKEEQKKYIRN